MLTVRVRPGCPKCGREIVGMKVGVPKWGVLNVWACDCDNPGLASLVLRAREWDEAGIALNVEVPGGDTRHVV